MQFYDFVDCRQSTQVALERALGYLMDHEFTLITDELEAARFLEQGRIKVNQTEHSIIGDSGLLAAGSNFEDHSKGTESSAKSSGRLLKSAPLSEK